MNARSLIIVTIVALLACFAPSPAYADLFSELEDYDGDMWRNNVSEDAYYGSNTSTEYGSLSVQLILSDIYQYNTDLLARAQSPAAQLAVQLTQLDFIRGAYGRLTQIKNYVLTIDSKLGDVRNHTHDMKLTLDGLYTYVVDIDDKVETAADKLTSIKSDTQALNSNLDLVVESINTFGVIQQGISDKISNVYARQQSIFNSLSNFRNETHSDLYAIHQDGLTTNDYLNSFDEYLDSLDTDLDNVLVSLSDVVAKQQDIISELQNLNFSVTFPESISINNWPNWPSFQPIIDAINSFKEIFETLIHTFGNYKYLQVWLPWGDISTSGITYVTVRYLNTNFSTLFDYLTNQDGVLKQIRDLLNVSNPNQLVGDFDSVEFDTNVDDLVSRLATVAPFGALLMVSAELDILHSVSAIQQPSFKFPFEFFGQETVTIDLGFLADARPLFNFVVVFGFVYMLLIYSIEFIKEGEL